MNTPPAITLYRWRIRNPRKRSGWEELSYAMTEEDARARHGDDVEMIPGSAEVRENVYGSGRSAYPAPKREE